MELGNYIKEVLKSYELFCDTPNITFRVYDDLNTVLVHYYDNPVPEK